MNIAVKIVLVILVAALVIPVVWEYVFIRFDIGKGFVVYGALIITFLRTLFMKIGRALGCVISILDWIGLHEVIKAVGNVGSFYFQLFTSWWWTFVGFFSYMEMLNNSVFYVASSLAVLALFLDVGSAWIPRLEKLLPERSLNRSLVIFGNAASMSLIFYIFQNMYEQNIIPTHWIRVDAWF